jgi:hypothetical protein
MQLPRLGRIVGHKRFAVSGCDVRIADQIVTLFAEYRISQTSREPFGAMKRSLIEYSSILKGAEAK